MTTHFDDASNSAESDHVATSASQAWSDSRGGQFSPERVAATDARIAQTGILEKLAAWRAEDNHAAGAASRPTLISERALLVGLLLLASEHRALWMSSLAEAFQYRLTPESRTFLGLPDMTEGSIGDPGRAERWCSNTNAAFHRMLALMDPFPQDLHRALTYTEVQAILDSRDSDREEEMKTRLDDFTNAFLQMTFMQQPLHLRRVTSRIDISVDQMFIQSPIPQGFARKTLATKVASEVGVDPRFLTPGPIDVFAGWHLGGMTDSDSRFAWGWEANIAVRVDSERPGESRFPLVAISATLSLPNVAVAQEAVSLMRAALDTGLAPGIVDTDKQYFASTRIERLHEPTAKLGFTPSTDYRAEQLGVQELHAGAEFIEGTAYCPGMPATLKDASKELYDKHIDEVTYRDRLLHRAPFKLRPKSRPDSKGRVRMMCPAVGASPTVTCPLRETSEGAATKPRPRVAQEDIPDFPGEVCAQHSVTFPAGAGMRQRQAFAYKSPEWEAFHRHARRSSEGLHAAVQDLGRESIGEASRRSVRGIAAAQVFVTILLTNYNLRTISAFLDAA